MQPEDLFRTAEDILSRHDAFTGLLSNDEKDYLLERGVLRSVTAGQIICHQHDRAGSLYIVLLGEVEVSQGEKSQRISLARLGQGELFGEVAALFRMPRVSTVIASKPSVLLEIEGDVFEDLLTANGELLKAVLKRFGDRITETALRSVSFLRFLPIEILAELQQHAALLSIPPGGLIVKEGEPGEALYILIHGAARVTHHANGKRLNLALLGPGDYFGEWSVLTGAPRAATVTTLSNVHAIRLDREPLLYFIQKHPVIRDRIDQVAHNRYEKATILGDRPDSEQAVNQSIEQIQSIISST